MTFEKDRFKLSTDILINVIFEINEPDAVVNLIEKWDGLLKWYDEDYPKICPVSYGRMAVIFEALEKYCKKQDKCPQVRKELIVLARKILNYPLPTHDYHLVRRTNHVGIITEHVVAVDPQHRDPSHP